MNSPTRGPMRPRALSAIALLVAAAVMSYTATARAGGAVNLTIKANSTASDRSVGAVVTANAEPKTVCSGQVSKGHAHRRLPSTRIGPSGAIYWQWEINGRVRAGEWSVRIRCRGARGWQAARTARFPALAGVGPGQETELFVPGSVRTGARGTNPNGSGGAGASLYPPGQCTWWVALLRPDLPWFPGEEGDALNWAEAARKRAIPTGSAPAVGAVAVFAPGQDGAGPYGHVAYVTAVDEAAQTITISEYDFAGKAGKDVRTIPSLGLTYIYKAAAGAPSKLEGPSPDEQALPAPGTPTYAETTGGAVETWSDYSDAGGAPGAVIPTETTVRVFCRITGLKVSDGDTWWYRLASSPWDGAFYASADAFYNDGATSGSLIGTPPFDPTVPEC